MTDHVTTGERYARASVTQNMRMEEYPCDVDKLLAAGYAQAGDERRMLALRLHRMQTTGDRQSVDLVIQRANEWLQMRVTRKGLRPMPLAQRAAVVALTLGWWLDQRCPFCNGTGFDVVEGTPALSKVECAGCAGTRTTPLKRLVPPRLLNHAEWLVREWDAICSDVIADMRRLLNTNHCAK